MVPIAISKILSFSRASGLTLNLKNKCELQAVHSSDQNNIENISVKNENKQTKKKNFGLVVTKNIRESANILPRLCSTKKFNHWVTRNLRHFPSI